MVDDIICCSAGQQRLVIYKSSEQTLRDCKRCRDPCQDSCRWNRPGYEHCLQIIEQKHGISVLSNYGSRMRNGIHTARLYRRIWGWWFYPTAVWSSHMPPIRGEFRQICFCRYNTKESKMENTFASSMA